MVCDVNGHNFGHFSSLFFIILPSVNAADNKQRDKNMSCIKVNIDV